MTFTESNIPSYLDAELLPEEAISVHQVLREGFKSNKYRALQDRKAALKKLKETIQTHESEITAALAHDLGKPAFEAYTSEIGFCYQEIDHALSHLDDWAAVQYKEVGIALWPASAESHYLPKGVVLILTPWNYPFNLSISPLISAVAAGNCSVVKPAEDAPATAFIIEKIIEKAFAADHVKTIQGPGKTVVDTLMSAGRFDHVFYTGSTAVGSILGERCGRALIPCTLELGGKSPAVVFEDCHLSATVDRLIWGKCFNTGQTCVAPDYVLVERGLEQVLLQKLKEGLVKAYGERPEESQDFGRIINLKQFDRLATLLSKASIFHGGQIDKDQKFIAPTLLTEVDTDGPIMQQEIFGPLLPIIPFDTWEEAKSIIEKNRNPLAGYVFTSSRKKADRFIEEVPFGGGCVNDAIIHLGIPSLPFGGIQASGIGRYHADEGFKTFSNQKSIARTSGRLNPKTRYAPYKPILMKAVKWLLG